MHADLAYAAQAEPVNGFEGYGSNWKAKGYRPSNKVETGFLLADVVLDGIGSLDANTEDPHEKYEPNGECKITTIQQKKANGTGAALTAIRHWSGAIFATYYISGELNKDTDANQIVAELHPKENVIQDVFSTASFWVLQVGTSYHSHRHNHSNKQNNRIQHFDRFA